MNAISIARGFDLRKNYQIFNQRLCRASDLYRGRFPLNVPSLTALGAHCRAIGPCLPRSCVCMHERDEVAYHTLDPGGPARCCARSD